MSRPIYGYNWRTAASPIKIDSEGHARVLIVGNSGAGKSTTADRLGDILGYPVMHLDEVHWRPNWISISDSEFSERVQEFVNTNKDWIVDGNYTRVVGDILSSNATCILWLDPPFWLYFTRNIYRTFARLLGITPPCSPGCDERLSNIFCLNEKSILWWCWTHHNTVKERNTKRMQEPGEDKGGKWVRLGGWSGEEAKEWFDRVEQMKRSS